MRNPFVDSYHWSKRIWAPNPFVVLLRKAQTDLAIRIWTILVPIRLKKPEKNGFGTFSYKCFVCIRVGLSNTNLLKVDESRRLHVLRNRCTLLYSLACSPCIYTVYVLNFLLPPTTYREILVVRVGALHCLVHLHTTFNLGMAHHVVFDRAGLAKQHEFSWQAAT